MISKHQQHLEVATDQDCQSYYLETGPGEDSHPTDCHDDAIFCFMNTPAAIARDAAFVAVVAWQRTQELSPVDQARAIDQILALARESLTESIKARAEDGF